MADDFVELNLQFLKGHVEVRDSKEPGFGDGKYQSFSRLVKKIGDKLYLEIVLSNKNPNLRCHKCKRRVPLFYPFGYVYKQVACGEGESIVACLDCITKTNDQELASFIMTYGQTDLPPSCEKCPDKNDPETCPLKQKWDKIGKEIVGEIQSYFEEREKKRG